MDCIQRYYIIKSSSNEWIYNNNKKVTCLDWNCVSAVLLLVQLRLYCIRKSRNDIYKSKRRVVEGTGTLISLRFGLF